ncbi:hypothetical protein ACR6C2_17160 [Streptomyces sp. INA 01156]
MFTGGAGAAAKSGAVARTVGALGKTARLVDPMTYLGKAATFGTVKVTDLFAGLRACTRAPTTTSSPARGASSPTAAWSGSPTTCRSSATTSWSGRTEPA